MAWEYGPLRPRLDEACFDGEGINVTKEDVIALLDALHEIAKDACCVKRCTNRACRLATTAVIALKAAGEKI